MRSDVVLEVVRGDQVLVRQEKTIFALARNEWGGPGVMPELLAAFVMPNDPAVARLLKDASRALAASGRSDALNGYQTGARSRVWELLAAIWTAVCARRLSYAEPPASFETMGQKVRTPSDIDAQGLATCLDTTLLFAAAAEQIGLNSIVVFTRGHALCGVWLQPQTLSSATVDEAIELRKAVDQKELVLFETTLATGATPATFSKATTDARRKISEEREEEFLYALDIKYARGRGIHPIAQQTAVSTDIEPQEAEGLVVEAPPELPGFDLGVREERPPETPAERIELWKRKLLDLTKANRLLNLRTSLTAIPIFCPDPAALEDRIAEGRRIAIIPPPDQRTDAAAPDPELRLLRTGDDLAEQIAHDALERGQIIANIDPKTLERGVLELFRKAKADLQEGGSNTLFLALGSLRWRPRGETIRSYRAPLILLPVRLERKSAASKPYLSSHDDEAVFNLTLIEFLRQEFTIPLSDLTGELPKDHSGIDVRRVWELVRARVRETPGFEVVEEVTLSTFSFAKYLMWKDLADRTEALKGSSFVRHLIETPREPYRGGATLLVPSETDERIDPAELFAPLNADSSQIVAIHASAGDGDFVLEGPPGTGKSETIGNIIAHNLACGRRVLFVSEKMAALEVVHRRLRQSGLGPFCLELHSSKASKRAVLEQLGAAWESAGEKTAIEWAKKADLLRQLRSRLNGLVGALHAPGPAGVSPRDAIGRVARWGDVHPVTLDWGSELARADRAPTSQALEALENCARHLGLSFQQVTAEDRAAFAAVNQNAWSYAWAARAEEAARTFVTSLHALWRAQADLMDCLGLDDRRSLESSARLGLLAQVLPRCATHDLAFALEPDGEEKLVAVDVARRALLDYLAARQALPAPVSHPKIMAAPIDAWRQAQTAALTRSWLFRGRDLDRLRRKVEVYLDWPPSKTTEVALEALASAQAKAVQAERILLELPSGLSLQGLDTDPSLLQTAAEVGGELRSAFLALVNDYGEASVVRDRLQRLLSKERDLLRPGMPIPSAAAGFLAELGTFLEASAAFRREVEMTGSATIAEAGRTAMAVLDRTSRLNFWCGWVAARRTAEATGLGRLVEALEGGLIGADQAVEAFRTAYSRWAAPLLIDARPELRGFSSATHESAITAFRELDREMADITADYVRVRLSQAIPRKDAPQASSGLGVLARELQKKARHKPIRQLVGEMGDSLLTLTPCLMMSPLSVAQFLPADQSMFDLVVFDEASQITVPDAIGAIARGRRVIVVGDPKQMPPTSFFNRAADEDDGEGSSEDLESILDEALAARVPHHRLTGHYRSRHESLIAFSNHAYYDASLVTYPSADTRESAVVLRRVDGVYARGKARTNPVEAQALVAELVRRLRSPGEAGKSIGVVTLNSQQQRLIEDLLDAERRADPHLEEFFRDDAAEPVFVKNLETVQGDQRDVIMISIGYGPTEPGARTMSMGFGPLNSQGGERRLNVAITRATTEVLVFASFGPEMIDLTRTSARAVQELKHYLEFAERGPAALGAAVTALAGINRYDSDFEMAVAEGLRHRGWVVRTQVGVSKFRVDLGIVHPDAPGRFLAGVECDGAAYHSSPSARDRDRVRHIILEQLGWRLLRLWSTDWFLDPAASLEGLDSKLRALLEADRATTADEPEEAPSSDRIVETGPPEGVVPGGSTFSTGPGGGPNLSDAGDFAIVRKSAGPADLADVSVSSHVPVLSPDPARFYDPDYTGTLVPMINGILFLEAPITLRRLARLIARRHGFQRTGREIVRVVREAVVPLGQVIPLDEGEEIVWLSGIEPSEVLPFRGLEIAGVPRPWSETPYPEKLGFAGTFIGHPDPIRAMADALGLGRLTGATREEFEVLLSAAGSLGR